MKKIYDQYRHDQEATQLQYPCRHPTHPSKVQQGWVLIDPLQKSIAAQTDLNEWSLRIEKPCTCDASTQTLRITRDISSQSEPPLRIDRAQQTEVDPRPTLSSRLVAFVIKTLCCLSVNPLDS